MSLLVTQLAGVKRIMCFLATKPPRFLSYKSARWRVISETAFFDALYSQYFIRDEKASTPAKRIYVRKS